MPHQPHDHRAADVSRPENRKPARHRQVWFMEPELVEPVAELRRTLPATRDIRRDRRVVRKRVAAFVRIDHRQRGLESRRPVLPQLRHQLRHRRVQAVAHLRRHRLDLFACRRGNPRTSPQGQAHRVLGNSGRLSHLRHRRLHHMPRISRKSAPGRAPSMTVIRFGSFRDSSGCS